HDIAIAEITDQFLSHLEVVRRIDVERAGDYLLVAATLMLIKSRALLPRPEDEDDAYDEELDPRTDLVRQLLEYKHFKDTAQELNGMQRDHALRFRSGLRSPKPDAPDAGKLLEDVGVDDLLLAFERMMRETLAAVDHEVFGEVLPLREVETIIAAEMATAGGEVFFRDLFWERRDRFYIVSVFLCLLEMLRRRLIAVDAGDDVVDLKVRLLAPEGPAGGAEEPVSRLP
ncbi:MAG: segregation/condensation protein A, partial [Planctomycetota bacterium]|nr:segregation/condensation protein A [Planctomycetota bacterium]